MPLFQAVGEEAYSCFFVPYMSKKVWGDGMAKSTCKNVVATWKAVLEGKKNADKLWTPMFQNIPAFLESVIE